MFSSSEEEKKFFFDPPLKGRKSLRGSRAKSPSRPLATWPKRKSSGDRQENQTTGQPSISSAINRENGKEHVRALHSFFTHRGKKKGSSCWTDYKRQCRIITRYTLLLLPPVLHPPLTLQRFSRVLHSHGSFDVRRAQDL